MFKRLGSIILILFLMLPQIMLSKVKLGYTQGKEIGITKNEINIINDLKKNDILIKNNKLIDYDKMNLAQTNGIKDARSLRFDYEDTIEKLTNSERREAILNSYNDLENAEKIMVNYLLYAKGKEPIETIKELNKKLEVYQENLDDIFEYKIFGLIGIVEIFAFSMVAFLLTVLGGLLLNETNLLSLAEARVIIIPIVAHSILAAALPIKNPYILTTIFLILEFILYNSSYNFEKLIVARVFENDLQ